MDEFCRRVRSLYVIIILNSVIDALEVLVNWQGQFNWIVHTHIFGFEVRGCYFSASIKLMTNEIMEYEYEEAGVIFLQLLEVRVFNRVYDFIIERLVHCSRIFVDYPSLFVLTLELVSVGRSIIWWKNGVYSQVRQAVPLCV